MLEWNTILLVTGLALGAWVALAAGTHLVYWRAIGQPWAFWRVAHLLPYASVEAAERVADDRRARVRDFLRRYSDEGETTVPFEFIELPPPSQSTAEQGAARFDDDQYSAAWHTARLVLQQRHDRYLIVERFLDALVDLCRADRLKQDDFPEIVRLEPLPWWARIVGRNRYPWRVVAVSRNPSRLAQWLVGDWAVEWFGIGVDVIPSLSGRWFFGDQSSPGSSPQSEPPNVSPSARPAAAPLGRCVMGDDGLAGVVGGVLEDGGAHRVGVTCRHVLSSQCGSVIWPRPIRPTNLEFTQEAPDLAIIEMNPVAPCFSHPEQRGTPIAAATLADLELAVGRKTAMVKSSDPEGVQGVVLQAEVRNFYLDGFHYRGFHFQLTPRFRRRFWIVWPIFRNFTAQGDSGGWIINTETRQWMGMVIGGYERPNTTSIGLASEYILEAIRLSRHFPRLMNAEVLIGG